VVSNRPEPLQFSKAFAFIHVGPADIIPVASDLSLKLQKFERPSANLAPLVGTASRAAGSRRTRLSRRGPWTLYCKLLRPAVSC